MNIKNFLLLLTIAFHFTSKSETYYGQISLNQLVRTWLCSCSYEFKLPKQPIVKSKKKLYKKTSEEFRNIQFVDTKLIQVSICVMVNGMPDYSSYYLPLSLFIVSDPWIDFCKKPQDRITLQRVNGDIWTLTLDNTFDQIQALQERFEQQYNCDCC